MNEDLEIGALRLAHNSALVLTGRHVFQQRDDGFFGESRATIARDNIVSVRIGWRRSSALFVFGGMLLVCFLILLIGSILTGPAAISRLAGMLQVSPSIVRFIGYGLLAGGVGLLVLFGFYRRNEIVIMAPNATLGGVPRSYEEAERFYSLLVTGLKEPTQASQDNKPVEAISQKTSARDWQL